MREAGRQLFVALVTSYLLARILAASATPLEIGVYGLTAAVGLEYLVASWQRAHGLPPTGDVR
ncbi:MAG: hypothetical protein ACRDL0_03755 [Thermoleophilaceae bacterium]